MPNSEQIYIALQTETPSSKPGSPATAATPAQTLPLETSPPQPRRRGRRRLNLCDAMRACGLDERKIAGIYRQLAEQLSARDPKPGDKMLADLLKELTRMFGARHAQEEKQRAKDELVSVQLVHRVPRPVRRGNASRGKS